MWNWIDTVTGLVVGFLAALLVIRGRHIGRSDVPPIVQCGNCGQPTSAFCKEHRDAIKAGWRS